MALIETFAKRIYVEQESQRAKRDQVTENSARQAFFTTEHQLNGTGYVAVRQPIVFDCVFTKRPAFHFGPMIVKMPDTRHWRYPLTNAGVYAWVTEPTPEARAAKAGALAESTRALGSSAADGVAPAALQDLDNSAIYSDDELLYKGAFVYFVVNIDPVLPPRTDGSNLAALQAELADNIDTLTSLQIASLNALIAEAQEAVYLTAHPAQSTMIFSLTWMGVALKTVPDTVTDQLHGDPTVAPQMPPLVARGS